MGTVTVHRWPLHFERSFEFSSMQQGSYSTKVVTSFRPSLKALWKGHCFVRLPFSSSSSLGSIRGSLLRILPPAAAIRPTTSSREGVAEGAVTPTK